jgi:hypothetical protein
MDLRVALLEGEVPYTGRELRSGWAAESAGWAGDIAVGFIGPCRVANEDLVDLDDARAGTFISAAAMAHVIVEHPDCRLSECVLRQRLLVCVLADLLRSAGLAPRRDGDDLYVAGRKLTVSIAAPAAASSLIHLGINIDPTGAPVPAVGLVELCIDGRRLLADLLEAYRSELRTIDHAGRKVRTVP